jgi:hypothetical protein
MLFRFGLAVVAECGSLGLAGAAELQVQRVDLPSRPPIELRLLAKLGPGPGKENSGIVKSRRQDDVFWIHNDSGDEPRI